MPKSPNQLPNCLNRAETSIILSVFYGVLCDIHAAETSVLSVFDGVLCDVRAYTVTVSVTWIRYQKSCIEILVSAQIEQVQDKDTLYLSSLSFNRLSFEYY